MIRFLIAQKSVYKDALKELKQGKKRTCWMWFIFPQEKGLGTSPMSEYYGLSGVNEAKAYLSHPKLGKRLIECMSVVGKWLEKGKSVEDIFPYPDNLKFRSCVDVFLKASEPGSEEEKVLGNVRKMIGNC